MITADLLKRIPLFAGIPDDERASLAARAADVRLHADEWLILEGQTPSFFALLEGRLSVEISGSPSSNRATTSAKYRSSLQPRQSRASERWRGRASPDWIRWTSTISSRTAVC